MRWARLSQGKWYQRMILHPFVIAVKTIWLLCCSHALTIQIPVLSLFLYNLKPFNSLSTAVQKVLLHINFRNKRFIHNHIAQSILKIFVPYTLKNLGIKQLLNRPIAMCNITQRKQFTQVICISIETTGHNKCYIFQSCSFIFNQGSCHNHKVFINFVGRLVRHIQLWHQVMEKHSPTAIKRKGYENITFLPLY